MGASRTEERVAVGPWRGCIGDATIAAWLAGNVVVDGRALVKDMGGGWVELADLRPLRGAGVAPGRGGLRVHVRPGVGAGAGTDLCVGAVRYPLRSRADRAAGVRAALAAVNEWRRAHDITAHPLPASVALVLDNAGMRGGDWREAADRDDLVRCARRLVGELADLCALAGVEHPARLLAHAAEAGAAGASPGLLEVV